MDLHDRLETTDGSRPTVHPAPATLERSFPLAAFQVLTGGDVFDAAGRGATAVAQQPAAATAAQHYVQTHLQWGPNAQEAPHTKRILTDITHQLSGNPALAGRLQQAKTIRIDVVAPTETFAHYGLPGAASPLVAGLFWDSPEWPQARIALRQEALAHDPALVVHEMAHALFYLGLTATERTLIYNCLRPAFFTPAAMDEVFAIYSEREFLSHFSKRTQQAPGIYGYVRRQWSENHLFTRFIRKLYFPGKPLAGPQLAPAAQLPKPSASPLAPVALKQPKPTRAK